MVNKTFTQLIDLSLGGSEKLCCEQGFERQNAIRRDTLSLLMSCNLFRRTTRYFFSGRATVGA